MTVLFFKVHGAVSRDFEALHQFTDGQKDAKGYVNQYGLSRKVRSRIACRPCRGTNARVTAHLRVCQTLPRKAPVGLYRPIPM